MEQTKIFNDSLKNQKHITVFAISLLVICNIFWYYRNQRDVALLTQKVFVATDNGTMAALSASHTLPSIYEARHLVSNAFQLLFSNDAQSFTTNTKLAFKLMDQASALHLYGTFKEGRVLEKMHRYSSKMQYVVDSIRIDMSREPYQCLVYGAQEAFFEKEKATQPLAARFQLVRQARSDSNPYGLQIQSFNFIKYERNTEE